MRDVVIWQRVEGALVFVAALAILTVFGSGLPWWLGILLFFAPDLSFAAYLAGRRIGAVVYNLVHLYALGAGLLALGLVTWSKPLASLGALWLAHAGFDRMLGYGLKSNEGFAVTHLGRIGAARD